MLDVNEYPININTELVTDEVEIMYVLDNKEGRRTDLGS